MLTQQPPQEHATDRTNRQLATVDRTRFEIHLPSFSWLFRDPRRTAVSLCKFTGVVLLAAIAAEIFLRLTMPREIAFETQFTPGIHQPNSKYGFVFTPNYRGRMFHVDNVMNVPLTHDKHGFRPAAATPAAASPDEIVLIGGASMIYGYGVPHEYTVPATMVRSASGPIKVYNAAWPGFDIYRMFHVYRDLLEPEASPKVAVLCLYTARRSFLNEIPDDFQAVPEPPSRETLFRYMDNLVLRQNTGFSGWLGAYYYKSFLLARTARFVDFVWKNTVDRGARFVRKATRGPGRNPDLALKHQVVASDALDEQEIGIARLVKFLTFARNYFRERGTDCIVVIIPTSSQSAPADEARKFNARIAAAVSPHLPCFDLHNELAGSLRLADFLGDSHYGPHAAEELGRRLADLVDTRLQARLAGNNQVPP